MAASYQAEQLKERGNIHFKQGEFEDAVSLYSQAIQKNSGNPLLYTNRGKARMQLRQWQEAIDDALRSIDIQGQNMKAYFLLAQAQLELNHPNEALSSALTAYQTCVSTPAQTNNAFTIAGVVLKCKKAKWELRQKHRLHRRNELLREFEEKIELDTKKELDDIEVQASSGQMGKVEAEEERAYHKETAHKKVQELRSIFAIADPKGMEKREVPEYLVDAISFEIMHDPVITKHGHTYERATIVEALKRNPTDPLTRDPLTPNDLRPNHALKKACDEFWEQNSGWAYDW
ncbi:U-box-domain-containing protein [Aulographum hederae CBS 113979]|uniref:U-box-domain-containing protein n=1 Tax=Aulographum hederae CBS 113979 TaxID=1176131 RepID=A0A6G1H2J7_9PEZI|nr:U-box-domain-containing protein [Aulographum hederae CBS 113979]